MVPMAPRYHPLILGLVHAYDDPAQPIAETWRRVGAVADEIGLFRPSYSHLRRLVLAKRRRELGAGVRRSVVLGTAAFALGLAAGGHVVARRRRGRVRARPEFVLQEHKRRRGVVERR